MRRPGTLGLMSVALLSLSAVAAVVANNAASEMPGKSYRGELPPMTAEQKTLSAALRVHLKYLCESTGERNFMKAGSLKKSADYIYKCFADLKIRGARVTRHPFTYEGRPFENIILEIPGDTTAGAKTVCADIVLIGAHYDTVEHCPGADDNGSGTVALIELARILGGMRHTKTLRFVAFSNEEYYFRSHGMGSYQYAKSCAQARDKITAMLSLETIGFYSDKAGSQQYPAPMAASFPDKGNYIGFVGTEANAALVRRAIGCFREHCKFPSEGMAANEKLPGIDWSDHWSFGKFNIPAIMITDTAPYRNPCYHQACDTVDKIDFDRMARVVGGLVPVISDLAGGDSK